MIHKELYKHSTQDDDEFYVIYYIYFHIFEWMIFTFPPILSPYLLIQRAQRMDIYEY